jgi:Ca2+-dependent lipid-binding protein
MVKKQRNTSNLLASLSDRVRELEDEEDAARTQAALEDTDPKSWASMDSVRKELALKSGGLLRKKKHARPVTPKSVRH